MAEQSMTVTAEEREFLVHFLATALKDAKIEEHRTKTMSFREHIVEREHLIESLLSKLGHKPD
jgi:hypothetical protein